MAPRWPRQTKIEGPENPSLAPEPAPGPNSSARFASESFFPTRPPRARRHAPIPVAPQILTPTRSSTLERDYSTTATREDPAAPHKNIFDALAATPRLPRGTSWGAARRLQGLSKGAFGAAVV